MSTPVHDRTHWNPDSFWDDHDQYGSDDWELEVTEGATRLGYIDWVNAQIDEAQQNEIDWVNAQIDEAQQDED